VLAGGPGVTDGRTTRARRGYLSHRTAIDRPRHVRAREFPGSRDPVGQAVGRRRLGALRGNLRQGWVGASMAYGVVLFGNALGNRGALTRRLGVGAGRLG